MTEISVSQPAIQAFRHLGTTMEEVTRAINRFASEVRGLAWRAYHRAGCPHGETRAGLREWTTRNPYWFTKLSDA